MDPLVDLERQYERGQVVNNRQVEPAGTNVVFKIAGILGLAFVPLIDR